MRNPSVGDLHDALLKHLNLEQLEAIEKELRSIPVKDEVTSINRDWLLTSIYIWKGKWKAE